MGQLIYETPFSKFHHHPEKHGIEFTWLPSTTEMTEEEYQVNCIKAAIQVKALREPNALLDSIDLDFIIAPHMQEWSINKLVPYYISAGVKRMALIIPTNFMTNISVEQTVDDIHEENIANLYTIRYFDNTEQAWEWFKSESN